MTSGKLGGHGTAVQKIQKIIIKIIIKISISILELRIFSLMNCVLLGVLLRLFLDDITFEANILLLLLLEQPTLTNTVAH